MGKERDAVIYQMHQETGVSKLVDQGHLVGDQRRRMSIRSYSSTKALRLTRAPARDF